MTTPRDLRAEGITRVRVCYSDLLGTPRTKVVPVDLLEDAADEGLAFCVAVFAINHVGVMPDGTGLRDEVDFRDMRVKVDVSTLRPVPWDPGTAICLGDCHLDGEPLAACPRGILRRALAEASGHGLSMSTGHELEFFLLRETPDGRFVRYYEQPGEVYRMDPRVDPEGVVRAMEDAVLGMGLPLVCVNQEYDAGQWEINTRYGEALTAADEAFLLKLVVKETAARHGLVATFIGRPVAGIGTSGYHVHYSAWEDGRNVFADPAGTDGLSAAARGFLGGLLAHARGSSAVSAPTVNAYKRLAAMELAPYYVNWGHDNRSVYVRVPTERGGATRLESRAADGGANAYLVSAAGIFSGVDGVARSLDPGGAATGIYDGEGREVLPQSLGESLDALETDAYLRGALSEQFVQCFTTVKRDELRRFALAVTDWELNEYARAL